MQKRGRIFLKLFFFFLLNWIQKSLISQTLLKPKEKKISKTWERLQIYNIVLLFCIRVMLVSDRAFTLQISNKVRCTGEDETLKNYKMCVCTYTSQRIIYAYGLAISVFIIFCIYFGGGAY